MLRAVAERLPNRVVVELDDKLYRALLDAVERRSNSIRKATVAEVLRTLIQDYLVVSA